jgi:acyl-CoA thioesterase
VSRPKLDAPFDPEVAALLRRPGADGFATLLGITTDQLSRGAATAYLEIRPELLASTGAVHGGVIATLVEHVLALAVYPLVDVGRWVATVELKLNHLGWARHGRRVARAEVELLRLPLAVASVRVECGDETVALAQSTLYVS